MADLETLQIRIKADADTAYKAIDKLAISLNNLSVSIGRIETGKLNDLASGLDNVSYALKTAKQAVKTSDYTAIFKNFTKLSNIDTARLNNLAGSLNNLASGFTNMTAANSASAYVKDMAAAIAKLGGVKVEAAVTNIPRLESALAHLLTTFSRIPTINQSVIDFVNSLSNLAAQGSHVGPATQSIEHSLESFGTSATRATRKARSLASVIGTLYAKFWLFARGAKALKNSFVSAADYLEAFNYFDVTARKIGKDTFTKAGVGSAEQYAEAFTKTLQEKLHKMSGLELDLEQRLIKTTNAKSLGLNLTELTQYQASIASITNAMGVSQEVAQSTSKVFSMLAGDIGSLRNMDFSQVSQKLQAGLAGQARALYSFGIDITNATLAEYAYAEGITKSVSEMTQAEKAQLRLLAILDQSKVAWGDLANTINSPSNQLRMLQTNLKEVGTVFGQLFIPIMESALPVINGLALAIKQLMVDIAELLGIKLNLDSFGQFGADIDADIESMDELNKAVKETKKGIREFDELKVIGGDKGVGTGVGDQIDLTKQIIEATNEYEKVWDEAYKRMTSKASEIAAYISGAFEPVKRIIEDFHIGDFFKAGEDTSKLIVSIFDFISDAIDSVDWSGLGKKIGDFLEGLNWSEIFKSLAGIIASAIQGVFDLWKGSLSAAPFETAIVTAFALMKFTGLGSELKKNLVGVLTGTLKDPSISKAVMGKIGALSLGIGLAISIDNVTSIKAGDYSASSVQSLLKMAVSSIFAGSGISLIAKSLGIASGGIVFAIGTAISLIANLALADAAMGSPLEAAKKVTDAEYQWISDNNLANMEVKTNIELRGTITQESLDNIDDLAKKVWDMSQNYDNLTAVQKGWLKEYSDQLVQAVPSIESQIDKITGAYKGTYDQLQQLIDKEKEQIILESYRQSLVETQNAILTSKSDLKTVWNDQAANRVTKEDLENQIRAKLKDLDINSDEIYQDVLNRFASNGTVITGSYGQYGYGFYSLIQQALDKEGISAKYTSTLAKERTLVEKEKETTDILTGLTKTREDLYTQMNKTFEEAFGGIPEIVSDSIDDATDILQEDKLPKNIKNTMDKVGNQISHGQQVSDANMSKMFRSINEAFYGLPDGKVPADVQATMDAIKQAIIDDSPEIINLMELLKLQMIDAFENAQRVSNGELAWNPKGVVTRIDQAFNSIQTALETGAKPGTSTLNDYIKELFGGNIPKEVNDALGTLADTIEKGEGKQAVLDALDKTKAILKTKSWEMGMYIPLGTAGGMFNGVGYVENATEYMVKDGFEKTYMKTSESSSPSRLARRLAKYLPEGAALGIEDGIPDVKSAIQSMVSVATSAFSNVRYNVPDLGLGSVNAQRGFNYGSMDSNNGFVAQMLNMANTAAQSGQTEVVFRVEGDPYGIFKVVREENDKYRRQHSNRSAF